MKNVIRIENKDLEIKEWNGERVVTVYDISNLHNKEVKRINENFKNNKDRFKIGKDYFEITTEEMRQSDLTTALSKYSNHKVEKLYKVGGVWVLYSKYENKGYTKVITSLDNKGEARELTKWTQKGREFLYRLLRDNDIVLLNEEV